MDDFKVHREKSTVIIPVYLCSFVCLATHLPIYPFIQQLPAKSMVLPWPHIYLVGTQTMQREGSQGDMVSWQHKKSCSVQHIPFNLSCYQISVI